MRSWTAPDIYKPFDRNAIIYRGPSRLNGDPIVVVATAQNGNRKIGHMVQLWIVPAISPIEAVRSGQDAAVCGDCKLRGDHGQGRACYVEYWRAVENIWQALPKANVMHPAAFARMVDGLQLRIGAYGDPAAVARAVWEPLLARAGGWTAYTHQWRTADPWMRAWCMASVDTPAEYIEAVTSGWRTFRVAGDGIPMSSEVVCPASEAAGKRTVCAKCELCQGASKSARNIVIAAHSSNAKFFPLSEIRNAS